MGNRKVPLLPTMPGSFVMRPHPENLDGPFGIIDLIHQTVLDVDTAGVGTGQIPDELLAGWWGLERILGDDVEQTLGLGFEIRGCNLFRILLGLLGINDGPTHQPGLVEVLPSGTAIPLRMESRIPGIETRKSVSWMLRQSSSDTSTALERFPVIWIGSCDSAASSRSW